MPCLQQHRKCDEGQPSCGRCTRLGIVCDYRRTLRWVNGTQLPRAPQRAWHRQTRSCSNDQESDLVSVVHTPSHGKAKANLSDRVDKLLSLSPHKERNGFTAEVIECEYAQDTSDLVAASPPLEIEHSGPQSLALASATSAHESSAAVDLRSSDPSSFHSVELRVLNDTFRGVSLSALFPSTGESMAYAYCELWRSPRPIRRIDGCIYAWMSTRTSRA